MSSNQVNRTMQTNCIWAHESVTWSFIHSFIITNEARNSDEWFHLKCVKATLCKVNIIHGCVLGTSVNFPEHFSFFYLHHIALQSVHQLLSGTWKDTKNSVRYHKDNVKALFLRLILPVKSFFCLQFFFFFTLHIDTEDNKYMSKICVIMQPRKTP